MPEGAAPGNINETMSKAKDVKKGAEGVMPYAGDSRAKGGQVESMFDSIAPAYDLMNFIMSLGMCGHWRNKAIRLAVGRLAAEPRDILDVATGTGDVAFALHRRFPSAGIIGIDLSEGMLGMARAKQESIVESAGGSIEFRQGDSLALEFPDDSFDLVTVAYGVRNFENLADGYGEMLRVLRPGGAICVVELSMPTSGVPLFFYRMYTRGAIPFAGRLISGDPRAYSYLHESIEAAPQRAAMTSLMEKAGFREARWKSLIPGVVTIYTALK